MAKKWAEVEASPQYQALEPEKREAARQQYFQQVIVPQLPADKVEIARSQFDAQTMKKEEPKDEGWLQAAKNVGEGVLKAGTGMVGSVVGDVAGLGSLVGAAVGDAVTGEVGGSGIDPAAIRDKVASALTYQPEDQNSTTSKILEAPGKLVMGAGEGLANFTGTADIPLLGDVVRAVPLAAASLMGVRAGAKGAAQTPGAAAPAAEAGAARPRSTVAPEAPPIDMPGAQPPALAAPRPVGLPAVSQPQLPAAAAQRPSPGAQQALPGPEPIPQAPPRAPLDPPAAKVPPKTRAPLKDLKNATPDELHADAVDTLLKNEVRLTTEQRGKGLGAKQIGSAARGAETLIGKSKLGLDQMQDFTAAVFDKVGLKARNATPDAMAELKKSSQEKYEKAHNDTVVKFDGEAVVDLKDLQAKAQRNPDIEAKFDKMVEHIRVNLDAEGKMTAEAATSIRAELGLMEGSSSPAVKKFAGDLKDILDTAAERSATPAQRAAMSEARGQYHFMKQIEDAIVHGKSGSFISPSKLLSVIGRKRNKNEAVYGGGDQRLVALAQAGKKVLPDDVGNSGTASRIMDVAKIATLLADPVAAIKVGGAALGGRYLNEASPRRGTPSAIREAEAKRAKGSSPTFTTARVAAVNQETEEQKKRRLAAEALRSN